MKTKGILLITCLALLLHDGACGCFGGKKNRDDRPVDINDYILEETVGEGTFAVVKKAKNKKTGEIVAIKIIDETKFSFPEEAKIMKMIKHKNILELFEEIVDKKEKKRYLVMEYASKGNVGQYLETHGPMNDTKARDEFGPILDAVEYLHGKNIVHRDLKPGNLVINEHGVIKLADFGVSTKFTPNKKLKTFPGSLEYAPPEIYLREPYDGPMDDVWSLGVVLYELVSGKQAFNPYKYFTEIEIVNQIISGTFSDPPDVSSECSAFIRKFIVKDPKKRCVLKDVKADKNNWLNAKTIH